MKQNESSKKNSLRILLATRLEPALNEEIQRMADARDTNKSRQARRLIIDGMRVQGVDVDALLQCPETRC